eukprot:scaffold37341_cov51-Attheya_sp.AAC.1
MEDLIKGDVEHGFLLVIPRDKVMEIVGAQVAPMNGENQNSINKQSEIVSKDRLTHNQSWTGSASGQSINRRVIDDSLQDCACLATAFFESVTRSLTFVLGTPANQFSFKNLIGNLHIVELIITGRRQSNP